MSIEHNFKTELGSYSEKILSYQEAVVKIRQCRERGLKVILAQGVFDIVHIGHLEYLRRAKSASDLLFVGLDSDLGVSLNKGPKRPFNNIKNRLEFLSQLQSVDYVFGFDDAPIYSDPESRNIYVRRLFELCPNALAVTRGDPNTRLKEIQAGQVGVNLLFVDVLQRSSTTALLKAIGYE